MNILDRFARWRVRKLEKRNTSQNPSRWFIDWVSGGASSDSGVSVTEASALTYTAVWSAVRVISETLASLPLPVYKREGDTRTRAVGHPVYTLLHDTPNPDMTAMVFRETMQAHVLTYGNAYAEIDRSPANIPTALWPLHPGKVTPKRNVAGELVYQIGPTAEKIIPARNILYVSGLGFDGIVGYSPIRMHMQAIGLGQAVEKYGARFFKNDAKPGGTLNHPGKLPPDAAERLMKSWQAAHSGDNAHTTALLEEGVTFDALGMSPEDAQSLGTREFQLSEIARIFRIPAHMIGDLSHATFSNIEHMAIEFVTQTIRPWCVRWEQEIRRKLFGFDTPYYAEHLVDGLLRGDIASRYAAYATGRQWGWLNSNDIRALENMNPVPGGEAYFAPMNMTTLEQIGETPDVAEPVTDFGPDPDAMDDANREALLAGWQRVASKTSLALTKAKGDAAKVERLERGLPAFIEVAIGPATRAYIVSRGTAGNLVTLDKYIARRSELWCSMLHDDTFNADATAGLMVAGMMTDLR